MTIYDVIKRPIVTEITPASTFYRGTSPPGVSQW